MTPQSLSTPFPTARHQRGSLLRSIWQGITLRRKHARDYASLMEMPDHLLQDIGLTRHDVAREAGRHARWWL